MQATRLTYNIPNCSSAQQAYEQSPMKDRQNGGNLYSHTAGWKQRQLRYGMNLKLIYDRIRSELLSRSAIA